MKNLSKFFIAVVAIAMSVSIWSCSKDDDDDKSKASNSSSTYSSSTYCWDFLYQGSVILSRCDLTESDADYIVSEMKKQGYSISKRRK